MLSIEQPTTSSFLDTEGQRQGRFLSKDPIAISWSPYDNDGEFYYAIALEDQREIPLLFIVNAYRTEEVDEPGVYVYNHFDGFLEEGLYRAKLYSHIGFINPKDVKGTTERYLTKRGFDKVVTLDFLVDEAFPPQIESPPQRKTVSRKEPPRSEKSRSFTQKDEVGLYGAPEILPPPSRVPEKKKQGLSFAQKYDKGLIEVPEELPPPPRVPEKKKQGLSFAQKYGQGLIEVPEDLPPPPKVPEPKKRAPRKPTRKEELLSSPSVSTRPQYDRSVQPLSFAQKWAAGYIDLPPEEKKKPRRPKKKAQIEPEDEDIIPGPPSRPVEMRSDDWDPPSAPVADIWSFF